MRFISLRRKRHTFKMSVEERGALISLLGFYPVSPGGRGAISKTTSSETIDEAQQLLDEALAEQTAESRRLVDAFLADPKRFEQKKDKSYRLYVKEAEVEWFLQVLNNIRVGSWMLLGSPEPGAELALAMREDAGRLVWSIYVSDIFLGALLYALEAGPTRPKTRKKPK